MGRGRNLIQDLTNRFRPRTIGGGLNPFRGLARTDPDHVLRVHRDEVSTRHIKVNVDLTISECHYLCHGVFKSPCVDNVTRLDILGRYISGDHDYSLSYVRVEENDNPECDSGNDAENAGKGIECVVYLTTVQTTGHSETSMPSTRPARVRVR